MYHCCLTVSLLFTVGLVLFVMFQLIVLFFNFLFYVCFLVLYVLLSILYILCFCIVLCTVSPHVYSCLFTIRVQYQRPLSPGGNPIAVNKYYITSYQNFHTNVSNLRHSQFFSLMYIMYNTSDC